MEQELLRKVQLTQLEIGKEIRRVCQECGIPFFIDGGTFLGAVRHQGFIPWDDDMDIGMLRRHYEDFCKAAPCKLGKDFVLQTWYTEPNYGLPFGKVMLRGTTYLEGKKSRNLAENGIYVDIFPYDDVPASEEERTALAARLLKLYRVKLMQSGYRPWMENGKMLLKKRLGYLFYQLMALGASGEKLARAYDELATASPVTGTVCVQEARAIPFYFDRRWCEELTDYVFEGERFPGAKEYDRVLTTLYGDYMVLPPEEERENRHQIIQIDFGAERTL